MRAPAMPKVKPIRPEEVAPAKAAAIPPAVIAAVNELILKRMSGNSATILQKDIVALALVKLDIPSERFDYAWLDFEPVYRAVGWKVYYDKPAFNEFYDANFTFTKP